MTLPALLRQTLTLALFTALPFVAPAQQILSPASQPSAQLQALQAPAASIPAGADLRPTTRLAGHLPAWARPANDAGPIPDASTLHLDIILKRPAAQQAAFDTVLAAQQNRKSPLFHAWLTPTQIGSLYGPAQSDLDSLTAWLTAQGLQIDELTPSHTFVRVSAPAASVARAFSTSFRLFTLADGRQLRSATAEPAIPSALTGLISAIHGLNDAPELPASHGGTASFQPASSSGASPQYSSGGGNHYLTPGDFNTIYDVPATPTSGTGQRIAVIGRSQVNPLDVTNFQALIGQPAKLPNTIVAVANGNPGQAGGGDQLEATLDVQRTLGEVPGAQTDLVIASNTYGGISAAAQYNVQTLLDPVMNISFGACEANVSYASVEFWTLLFSQAAAEGISSFVSAADSGVDTCAQDFTTPPASQVASINYICSSGFVTCVGGTEFNDTANPAQYWASSNSANRSSALSYIPEGVWNEPTTGNPPVFQIAGGGGGVSIYTPKPAFQAGPGVPADGFRDVPDLSFSSSAHDGYFACYALGGYPCTVTNGSFFYGYFYGTSDAAPGMASITALLNQQAGSPQGNLNPLLYRLAATPANGAFHDTTVASSGVTNCTAAVPSLCNNSTASPTALTGGEPGYLLTTGYDQASGLGSLDVAKFLAAVAVTGTPTSVALTGSSGNIPSGQSLTFSISVNPVGASTATPTGTIQLYANGNPLGSPVTLSGGKASVTLPDSLPIGANLVTATYTGDPTFSAANSNVLALLIVGGTAPSATLVTSNPNPTVTNQFTIITVTVSPAAGSGATPGGNVTLLRNNLLYSTSVLYKGTASFKVLLSAATYNFSASYTGDGTYASSISPVLQLVSAPGSSTTTLSGATSLPAGSTLTVAALVSNVSSASFFSFVTFLDGMTVLGTPLNGTTVNGAGNYSVNVTYTGNTPLSIGIHSITAVYNGDLNTLPSTSAPLIVAVGIPQAITVTPAATALTLPAGASTGNTDLLTLTSAGAFAGPVTFACTVAYNGTGTSTYLPTCTAASVTLAPQGTATTTLTIATTIPHDKPAPGRASTWQPPTGILLAGLAFLPLALLRRRRIITLALLLFTASLLAVSGCGGKSTPVSTPAPLVGTTPGSYTVTIVSSGTGTGNVTATTTLALTVQ